MSESKAKWQAEFVHSQSVTHLTINGQSFDRRRFEAEDIADEDIADEYADHFGHCEVRDINYHLLGCEEEACPRCRGQLISCPCEVAPVPRRATAGLAYPQGLTAALQRTALSRWAVRCAGWHHAGR